jgi:hypothetical protein
MLSDSPSFSQHLLSRDIHFSLVVENASAAFHRLALSGEILSPA